MAKEKKNKNKDSEAQESKSGPEEFCFEKEAKPVRKLPEGDIKDHAKFHKFKKGND